MCWRLIIEGFGSINEYQDEFDNIVSEMIRKCHLNKNIDIILVPIGTKVVQASYY